MKRLLATSFLTLAFFFSAAGVAQAAGTGESCIAGLCPASAVAPVSSNSSAPATGNPTAPAKSPALPTTPAPDPGEHFGVIMTWIMSLFAWLLGVAAITLDWAVYYTVVTMGNYVSHLTAVGDTWRILRDLGNIALIFGFLAAGIATILNVDLYGWGKKMLPMLLLAAVFINFSLFISEAVIDTGNIFATQFFTQINGGQPLTKSSLDQLAIGRPGTTNGSAHLGNEGISNKIMNQLGMQTLYGDFRNNPEVVKGGNAWIVGFLGIILFLITAFVMFSLAFILIARFVILLILIITAPIGFAGLAVPKLDSVAHKWWSTLFEQTITAPVLLLLLYVALKVITSAQFLTGICNPGNTSGGSCTANSWTGWISGNNMNGFASMMLSFLIAMGLLLAVVMVSKKMSAFGAGAVMKIGNGATKFAKSSALGTGRWAARNTVGRGLYAAQHAVMASSAGGTQAGRLFAGALGKGAHGYHDAKDKSVKAHEEYVKERGKVIEEHHNPIIANAQLNRAAAEKEVGLEEKAKAFEDAQAEQKAAAAQAKSSQDELARLEKIVNGHRNNGTMFSPEAAVAKRDLDAARAAAVPPQEALDRANEKLEAAKVAAEAAKEDPALKAAKKEEEEATKALAEAKKKAALSYVDSLENPLNWPLTGPGGSAAANKIIGDTLKKMSDAEKAVDILKKAFEKDAKASEKSAESGKKLGEARENLTTQTNNAAQAQVNPAAGGNPAGPAHHG